MSEQNLIDSIKRGDEESYKILIEQYQDKIFHVCIGFIHQKEDAEEVTQDVFIEVYNSINKFRGDSKLSTWLYRISVNKSLNFLRKKKRERIISSINSFYPDDETSKLQIEDKNQNNPQKLLELEEDAKYLFGIIELLPKNQKIAFALNKYEDLSYKDIADIMKLSLSSIESLIYRAKVNLQKKILLRKN